MTGFSIYEMASSHAEKREPGGADAARWLAHNGHSPAFNEQLWGYGVPSPRRRDSLGGLRQEHARFRPGGSGADQLDIAAVGPGKLACGAQAKAMARHPLAAAHPVKTLK
jgi:hypothetical protein